MLRERWKITLAENVGGRTVSPDLDMAVDRYEVTVTGPGPQVFRGLDGTATSTVISWLVPGEWTVTVNALNAETGDPPERIIVGSAVDTVTVIANETAVANMVAVPVDGQGTLAINMSWPAGSVALPGVSVALTPQGESPVDISTLFVVDDSADPHTATYTGPWDSGYYSMSLTLDDDGTPVWSWLEAARIIESQLTEANYTITAGQLNAYGGLTVNIGYNPLEPITITLTGGVDPLTEGSDMTVTADTGGVFLDTYAWYLNGVEQTGQTGSSIALGSTLAVGAYTLNVLVSQATTEGVILSSEGMTFSVVAP